MGAEQSGPVWWDAELVPPPSGGDRGRLYLRALQQRVGPEASTARDELEHLLQGLLDEIVADTDTASEAVPFRMSVGFLPIDGLDAVTVEVPGDEDAYLIALSGQVPTYVNLLAKACAQLLPIKRAEEDVSIDLDAPAWPARLRMEAPGVQRFLELMFASAGSQPSEVEPYWAEGDWLVPAEALRESGEAFLLARQFVHLALAHDGTGSAEGLVVAGERLSALRFPRERESDADVEALRLLLRIPRFAEHAALTCWAVDMLLSSYAMLEALDGAAETGRDRSRLAPPEQTLAGERRARLRDALDEIAESRPGLAELMGALDPVSQALWAHLNSLMLQRDS